jgi:hypothetical protein
MIRRLLALISALSLVLSAATLLAGVVLWRFSYHAARSLQLSHYGSRSPSLAGMVLDAEIASGRLILTWEDVNLGDDPNPQPDTWRLSRFVDAQPPANQAVQSDELWRFKAYWCRFGFEYSDMTAFSTRDRRIAVPMWFVSGALMCALITGARLHIRPVHNRGGSCASCGYDLRATECGRPAGRALQR